MYDHLSYAIDGLGMMKTAAAEGSGGSLWEPIATRFPSKGCPSSDSAQYRQSLINVIVTSRMAVIVKFTNIKINSTAN